MKKTILSTLGGTIAGGIGGAILAGKPIQAKLEKSRNLSDKHLALFLLMNEWMKSKQDGKHIKSYFEENGYKQIAVYGMSYVGERLIDELKGSGIIVKYAIDRNAESLYSELSIVSPEDVLPEVDAIIVTAITFFDEIQDMLESKVKCPIISFEDILYEL